MNVQILVLVRKDTNVGIPLVVIVVKTSTNVQLKDINAIEMLTVLILLAATIAFVTLVTKVMVNGVMMLTNVYGTHVMIHLYAVTHPALMNASAAQPVIMQVDHVVLILMNVLKASISVIRTLDVEIQKALIVATAIPAILEMVEIAVMLMSVQQTNTIVKTDIDALTQSVVSHVKMLMNARPISIDVTQKLYAETLLGLMTVPVELVTKVN